MYLEGELYSKLVNEIETPSVFVPHPPSPRKEYPGATIYEYAGKKMIQISQNGIGAVAYVSTKQIAEGMRVKS